MRQVVNLPYDHYFFLNLAAIDFVSVPAHKFQVGMAAAEAGEDDDDDDFE